MHVGLKGIVWLVKCKYARSFHHGEVKVRTFYHEMMDVFFILMYVGGGGGY